MKKKSSSNKTIKNKAPVAGYIAMVDPKMKTDAKQLLKLFKEVTGAKPKMWGSSIIGFGEYHYKYDSGREGDFLATGFSIRKSGPTIYILPGYADYSHLLKKLGPHKHGKSCIYLKNLEGIDLDVLKKLIVTGLKDLKKQYPVKM